MWSVLGCSSVEAGAWRDYSEMNDADDATGRRPIRLKPARPCVLGRKCLAVYADACPVYVVSSGLCEKA